MAVALSHSRGRRGCAQVCLGAAAALAATPAALRALGGWLLPRRATLWAAWLAPRAALTVAAVLSAMRITALVGNYGAPMAVYRHLPEVPREAACGHPPVAPSWTAGIRWQSIAEHVHGLRLCMQEVKLMPALSKKLLRAGNMSFHACFRFSSNSCSDNFDFSYQQPVRRLALAMPF